MRTVFERALTDMCEDAKLCRRHNDRTGYVDLNTNSIVCTPNRQADNEAFGFLAAAHLFITGHGPHPLSPAVIIFCIAGYDGLFDLELIGLLLPDYVSMLRKWPLAVPAATKLLLDRTSQRLALSTSIQVLVLQSQMVTVILIALFLFSHPSFLTQLQMMGGARLQRRFTLRSCLVTLAPQVPQR